MKQSIILGNIITMDEKRPFAKAALVKNGVFAYIGSAKEVKKLVPLSRQLCRRTCYRTSEPDGGRNDHRLCKVS